jgi:hypothetical protein
MSVEHREIGEQENGQELAEFERKLRIAMQRREAPLGMKQRVLARARERRQAQHGRWWMVQRIAASALLATIFGGIAVYKQVQERALERKRGEEARDQVMTALRITHKTLDHVNERLADNSKSTLGFQTFR